MKKCELIKEKIPLLKNFSTVSFAKWTERPETSTPTEQDKVGSAQKRLEGSCEKAIFPMENHTIFNDDDDFSKKTCIWCCSTFQC